MVKNQHYIPQFYLKRFGNNGKIDFYDRQKRKFILNTNVKNFASERFFYDIDANELKEELVLYKEYANISDKGFNIMLSNPQLIENHFSKMESRTNIYFNKFESNLAFINDENFISVLVNFVYTQSIRTKNYRITIEKVSTQISGWLRNMGVEKVANYPLDLPPQKIAQLEQLKHIVSLTELYSKLTLFFTNYDIFIGINDSDLGFILSEEPFLDFFLGFNDICVPINPKLCVIFQVKTVKPEFLLCKKKPDSNKIIHLDIKDVTKYTLRQYTDSSRYLFGNNEDIKHFLAIVKLLKSKNQ